MIRYVKVRKFERGFLFRDGVFERMLRPGRHWIFDLFLRARVKKVSVREPWVRSDELDVIVRSGQLAGEVRVLDLKDYERALVWVEGRFEGIYGAGLRVLWTVFNDIRVEVIDARKPRFENDALSVILADESASRMLHVVTVDSDHAAVLTLDGKPAGVLSAGRYAYWNGLSQILARVIDLREQVLDVAGQELMTADKVTLRLNAVVTFRVTDPVKALTAVDEYRQSLYREAQLALRAQVGANELDAFLVEKNKLSETLEQAVRKRAVSIGLEVNSFGIKDVVLPGDMKTILNRVTEARKAAEADLVKRREETAAMRSQANTARIFESNPVLMRLRELEVLEKVAENSTLSVVLGEGGLTERVVKLL